MNLLQVFMSEVEHLIRTLFFMMDLLYTMLIIYMDFIVPLIPMPLKDVQLYKGGFESKFGGRISSVTEITSKEGNQKNFNLGADLSLLSMNFFAEMPVGDKFSSFIAFRKSYQGALYEALFDKFNKRDHQPLPLSIKIPLADSPRIRI